MKIERKYSSISTTVRYWRLRLRRSVKRLGVVLAWFDTEPVEVLLALTLAALGTALIGAHTGLGFLHAVAPDEVVGIALLIAGLAHAVMVGCGNVEFRSNAAIAHVSFWTACTIDAGVVALVVVNASQVAMWLWVHWRLVNA